MHLRVVYAHILGALLFMLAHGASAAIIFRLRSERDPATLRALLGLSKLTLGPSYAALLLLLVAGVWAGIEIQAFTGGQMWLWTAIGVLVLILGAMYGLVSPTFFGIRDAIGDGSAEVDQAELDRRLASSRPMTGIGIGFLGILVILWLMVLKPF